MKQIISSRVFTKNFTTLQSLFCYFPSLDFPCVTLESAGIRLALRCSARALMRENTPPTQTTVKIAEPERYGAVLHNPPHLHTVLYAFCYAPLSIRKNKCLYYWVNSVAWLLTVHLFPITSCSYCVICFRIDNAIRI